MNQDKRRIPGAFLPQIEDSRRATKQHPSSYLGIKFKIELGAGRAAGISWIILFAEGET